MTNTLKGKPRVFRNLSGTEYKVQLGKHQYRTEAKDSAALLKELLEALRGVMANNVEATAKAVRLLSELEGV